MLAAALQSLVVVECEGGDGLPTQGQPPAALFRSPLRGAAASLDWGGVGDRIAVAVRGTPSDADRVCFVQDQAPGQDGAGIEEEVVLPGGVGATDVSMGFRPEDGGTWAAVSCSDGTLRVIDASPGAAPAVARTLYSHGVAVTAVRLSGNVDCIASGSASGNVVVQPFPDSAIGSPSSPTPLPSIGAEGEELGVTGLRYSPLRPDALAACDQAGHIQVWDTRVLRHICVFSQAHGSAARGLSFSVHNSGLLISGGDDATLGFWDVNNSRRIREVNVSDGLSSISYHSGGYLLAAGTQGGSVMLFDLRMLVSVSKEQPAMPVSQFSLLQADGRGAKGASVRAMAFAPPGRDGAPSPLGSPGMADRSDGLAVEGSPTSVARGAALLENFEARGTATDEAEASGHHGFLPQRRRSDSAAGQASVVGEPAAQGAALLPATPTLRQRGDLEAARFNISTSPTDKPVATSPWWTRVMEPAVQEQARAHEASGVADSVPPLGDAITEALRPLLAEVRQELLGEVREAQCALLEQNFRLHTELRRDVEELRAEVQRLRGELQAL